MLARVAAASGMKIYEEPNGRSKRWPDASTGDSARLIGSLSDFRLEDSYDEMIAWFCHADVSDHALRDGLNLVAKEYAAARRHRGGVLVLSEFTGASVVLDGAVLTNPYSNKRMDEAIESALAMPEAEQRRRMERMTDAVESYTVRDWADEQLSGFPEVVGVG